MTTELLRDLTLRGGNLELWEAREPEILADGPRGTGKTRTALELLDRYCHLYPGIRCAIVRKIQRSMAGSCLMTFNEQVLTAGDGVTWFGGNEREPASYRYPNGSRIVVFGLDDPEKVKSSEFSLIYFNEATEGTPEDWQSLKALLRQSINGELVIKHPRLLGDCNPTYSGHWLNQACERGEIRRIRTTLRDNPFYYDEDGNPTAAGVFYINQVLESYTGATRERWLEGKWTGVENAAYEYFDPLVHIRPLPVNTTFKATIIGTDYGATHECAVVAVSIDQWNRRWVREAWAQVDDDQGASLNLTIARFKQRYDTTRGMGDPNQRYLNDRHGFETAPGSAGSRQHRIDLLEPLFHLYPGGRVPTLAEEASMAPRLNYAEPDTPGIFLVEGAPGIEKLKGQIESYHYVFTESEVKTGKVIHRENDDMVAAVEYANQQWVEGGKPEQITKVKNPMYRKAKPRGSRGWTQV